MASSPSSCPKAGWRIICRDDVGTARNEEEMGIMSRQLRSVIEWKDPSPDVLFERWSEHGDEIKNASKLIVGPGQGCLFVYEGQILEAYTTPGMVDLRTGNLPFVTTLTRLMQGFTSAPPPPPPP